MNTACRRLALLIVTTAAAGTWAQTRAEREWAAYATIRSVSCEIRRETQSDGAPPLRTLSRVHWRREDRLHAETFAPIRRRVVADGSRLYSYIEGDPMGFSRPVAKLDPDWVISLRKIPATPAGYLLRLQGAPEKPLEGSPEFPERYGYATAHVFAVLSFDREGRLALVETYRAADDPLPLSRHRFEQWAQREGAWFSLRQRSEVRLDNRNIRETLQVLRLEVNGDLPEVLFQPERFFPNVRFTEDLHQLYPEPSPRR